MAFLNAIAVLAILVWVLSYPAVIAANTHSSMVRYIVPFKVDLAGIIGVLWLIFG